MRWKKVIALCMATGCLLAIPVIGSYSYLTDSSSITNEVTTANLSIDLIEEKYDALADTNSDGVKDEATYLVQGANVKADPKIKNESTLGIYAFMVVDIPTENVAVVSSYPTKKSTELFNYTVSDSNWVLMKTSSISGYTRRVYAYKNVVPVKGSTTNLFNSVTYANVVEGEIDTSTIKSIPIKGYGIQSNGFTDYQDAYNSFDWSQKEVQ